jgi:D-glycero-D-manno-heptose 1,7-bisphosphate phosphatase
MKPAIFLDRDGTIIKDKGTLSDTKQVQFYHYTFDCLRQLQSKYLLFIITNQPGIAKGIVRQEQVEKVNLFVKNILKNEGVEIKAIYCCPHQKSDNCECRKPKTYFLEKAQKEYSLDLKNSYVIGDHPADVELAINSEANGIFVLTGHGRKHYKELSEYLKAKVRVMRNIEFATKEILKHGLTGI